MAIETVTTNPGSGGYDIAADLVNAAYYQVVKQAYGSDGSAVLVSASTPLPVTEDSANGQQNLPFFRYLDTTGDGTGTKDAAADGSSTPVVYKIAPPASTIFRISRMIVAIRDAGTFSAEKYGYLTELTNGIDVQIWNGAEVLDLTDGIAVTTNAGWGQLCYDVDRKAWGSGDEFLLVRWTFAKTGQMIRLDGDASEDLRVTINDDLTDLVNHYFMVQGYTESSPT